MKRLNITKEQFNKSRYFQRKYGKLEYVSESGNLFKTNKGQILKFNESDVDSLIERQWARVGVKYDKRGWKTSLIYTDDNGNEVCFRWSVVKEILADIQNERRESGDIDEWIANSGVIQDHGVEILNDLVSEIEENPEIKSEICYPGPEI